MAVDFTVQSFNFESLLTSAKMTDLQDSIVHVKSAIAAEHGWSNNEFTADVAVHSVGGELHTHTMVNCTNLALYSRISGREIGGTGLDGSKTISTSVYETGLTYLDVNYVDFTVNANVTLTFSGRGPCIIRATSTIAINGAINADLGGAKGGEGGVTTDAPGVDGDAGLIGGSGGGGGNGTGNGGVGGNGFDQSGGVTGGGAGSDMNGSIGSIPLIFTLSGKNFTTVSIVASYGGGGGGGGGATGTGNADLQRGGKGGGYIYLEAPKIEIGAGASISADGEDGFSPGGGNDGGGGGGGGGYIHLVYHSLIQDGTAIVNTPTGGAGGLGDGTGTDGGKGGDGFLIKERRKLT